MPKNYPLAPAWSNTRNRRRTWSKPANRVIPKAAAHKATPPSLRQTVGRRASKCQVRSCRCSIHHRARASFRELGQVCETLRGTEAQEFRGRTIRSRGGGRHHRRFDHTGTVAASESEADSSAFDSQASRDPLALRRGQWHRGFSSEDSKERREGR